MKIFKNTLSVSLVGCLLLSAPEALAEKTKVLKKYKDAAADAAEDAAEGELTEQVKSAFFPDWSPPSFNWSIAPLIGAKYTQETLPGVGEQKRTTFEGGLMAGLFGVPVVPGNVGLYLEPTGGYVWAWGAQNIKDENGKNKTNDFTYERSWVNLDVILLAAWYRHTLGVGGGNIIYGKDKENNPNVKSAHLKNDFGVLVLSWLSTHYTNRMLKVYGDMFSFNDPKYEEMDHWLHARMVFSLMSFQLDVGPGFTTAEDFNYDVTSEYTSVAKGRTDYLLATASINPFWKIGGTGRAKYVYASTEEKLGTVSIS